MIDGRGDRAAVSALPDQLPSRIAAAIPPAAKRFVVAFSGGLDSTVLLHALSVLRPSVIRACHVHHGLQADADDWAEHCMRVAASLGVPCQTLRVRIDPDDSAGPEAAARVARYAALSRVVGEGDVLATAHHQDDQAETVLLRLLRGSGLRGLSAIQPLVSFAHGYLWRPLLDTPREVLADHARQHRLKWIDDPHNTDTRYTRSWLRQSILPELRARFPQVGATLAQAAAHASDSVELLDTLAAIDRDAPAHANGPEGTLSVSALLALSTARRNNLLRHWLHTQDFLAPDTAMLARIGAELLSAAIDAEPCLRWSGCELRRYRDALYAIPPLPEPPTSNWSSVWSTKKSIDLPAGCGTLVANRPPPTPLTVRFARQGERLRLQPSARSRTFKNLFQQAGIPPWARLRMPLIDLLGEPALVPGLGLVTAQGQSLLDAGWQVHWSSSR